MQLTANDFLEETIAERIGRILDSQLDKAKKVYKEQDDFTEGMEGICPCCRIPALTAL